MTKQLRVISVATCGECPFHQDRPFACVCAWDGDEGETKIVEDRDNQPEWCPLENEGDVLFTTRIHAVIAELDAGSTSDKPKDEAPNKGLRNVVKSVPYPRVLPAGFPAVILENDVCEDATYMPGISEATDELRNTLCRLATSPVRYPPFTIRYDGEIMECSTVFDLRDHLLEIATIEWGLSHSDSEEVPAWEEIIVSLINDLPLVDSFFKEIKWDICKVCGEKDDKRKSKKGKEK